MEKGVIQTELRDLFSPDIGGESIADFHPDDPEDFSLFVEVVVGPEGRSDINEFFYLQVCTPRALARDLDQTGLLWGRHRLLVSRWDSGSVIETITELVRRTRVLEWEFAVDYLGRYMQWAEERQSNPLIP